MSHRESVGLHVAMLLGQVGAIGALYTHASHARRRRTQFTGAGIWVAYAPFVELQSNTLVRVHGMGA